MLSSNSVVDATSTMSSAGAVSLSSQPVISSAPGTQGFVTPTQENEYVKKVGAVPTAVLMDPSGTLGRLYGAKTTPHMFIIDPSGTLIYYEKMDNTQTGSANVAIEKARTAALYKRPTKAFQDMVTGGGAGLRILGLPGAVPIDGGVPLIVDDKVVGAVGVSGGVSDQDGQCAQAAAASLK